jgi:hypothetical protein
MPDVGVLHSHGRENLKSYIIGYSASIFVNDTGP